MHRTSTSSNAASRRDTADGPKQVQERRIALGLAADQESEPRLQAEAVRDRADEEPARPQHSPRLVEHSLGETQVLEHLGDDDDVEGRVRERQRVVEVGPRCRKAALLRARERGPVDVHADDRVAVEVCRRERSVPAAEVEDAQPGPADPLAEDRDAIGRAEDEPVVPARLVMAPIGALDRLASPQDPTECRKSLQCCG